MTMIYEFVKQLTNILWKTEVLDKGTLYTNGTGLGHKDTLYTNGTRLGHIGSRESVGQSPISKLRVVIRESQRVDEVGQLLCLERVQYRKRGILNCPKGQVLLLLDREEVVQDPAVMQMKKVRLGAARLQLVDDLGDSQRHVRQVPVEVALHSPEGVVDDVRKLLLEARIVPVAPSVHQPRQRRPERGDVPAGHRAEVA